MKYIFYSIIAISIFLAGTITVSAQWSTVIGFDEPDWCAAIGGASAVLVDADAGQTTYTFDVDVVMPDGTTCPSTGLDNYVEGMDGIDDISINITVMSNQDTDSNWSEDHLDFDCANDRFNHDFSINGNNSASSPNDYSFAVIEFTWLNGLCVDIDNFGFDSSSTNGSSEMYEHALFYVNGALPTANLTTYTNDDYNGCNGATQTTMGNFLLGTPMVSEGNIAPGIWTDDGLNTTVACPPTPEAASTNPDAGTGGNNGVDPCGATDWDLPSGTAVTSFTTILGLQDVAYDTDGNGFTSSNTLPIARLNEIKIGKVCACPMTTVVGGTAASVCTLGTEISDWKATVEATDGTGVLPLNVMQSTADNEINIQIVYSATAGQTACAIDVTEPSGIHSGAGCANEDQTTYAYVICDLNTDQDEDCTTGTDDVTISEVGSITITYYPPAQMPSIAIDNDVCNYTITPACPNDAISPSPFTAVPGEDPPATNFTVTTENSCMDMFMLDPEECPAMIPIAMLGCPGQVDICAGVSVSINASDGNTDTAGTSTAVYGGTAAGFINTMSANSIGDDVIDPNLITGPGTYNLTLQLMGSDGTLSELVECQIIAVINCNANGGSFPTTGP